MMNDTTNNLVIGNNDDDNEIVYQNLADYWVRSAIETGKKHDRTILLQQRNQSFIQPQCPQFSFLEEDISIMEDDDETKLDSSTIVSCDDDDDSSRKGDTLSLFDDHPYETTNGCMNSSIDLLLCSETPTTENNTNKLKNSGISREIDSFMIKDESKNDDDNTSLFSSFPELDMSIPTSSPIQQQHTPIMQQTPIDHRNTKKTITMRTISPNAVFDFPEPMDNNTMSSFPPELVMCSYDSPPTKNYNNNNDDYHHNDDEDLFLLPDFHSDVTQYKLDLPSYSELVEDEVFSSSSSKLEFPILPDQITTKSYHDNTTMTTKRQMPTPFLSPK